MTTACTACGTQLALADVIYDEQGNVHCRAIAGIVLGALSGLLLGLSLFTKFLH